MKVSVAMISRNEENAVGKVIADIKSVLPKAEIIIVDSSTDRTPDIAKRMGAVVIRQFPPKGYGKAMMKVLKSAKGDVILTMDCDGTYPAEQMLDMIRLIEQGYDIVNASRLLKRPKNMPFANYFANKFLSFIPRILFGIDVTDVHSGMRAYRREIIENLDFDPRGPALPVDLLLKPIVSGYRYKEIGIFYNERIGRPGVDRFRSTMWTVRRILRLKFS